MSKNHPIQLRLCALAVRLVIVFLIAIPSLNADTATTPTPSRSTWTNSLGMQFVPVPDTEVLFSIWDTRVKDYKAFCHATGRARQKAEMKQTEHDPVVMVDWDDAKAFCAWLTKREHGSGVLAPNTIYRLPTVAEWRVAAGSGTYPWGEQWPPPKGIANVGESLQVDPFEYTSPVGSFPANKYGLYDMGGNVWQWCEDRYGMNARRLSGGGSWFYDHPKIFRTSSILSDDHSLSHDALGFRVVIAHSSSRSK